MIRARREFSAATKRSAYERSGGICECYLLGQRRIPGFSPQGCGVRMGAGNTWFEHIICDGIDGEPTLENCAALTKTCGRLKSRLYDLPVVAKTKRMGDRAIGIKSHSSRPLIGTKRSGWKQKLNGGWVRRDSEHTRIER